MNNTYLISLVLFIFGCLFGSFLSVLVHRTLHRQKGIIFGQSRCPKCKHRLHALDLIPILSWLFKRGRCSYCHKEISPIYPALELISGLLFVSSYNMVMFNSNFDFFNSYLTDWMLVMKIVFLCLISLNLLIIFFSDLQKKAIPNIFLYSWIALCLLAYFLITPWGLDQLYGKILAVLTALLFFGGQYLFSRGKWLGSGDIYVAVGMGLLLGFPKLLIAIFLAYLTGSLISMLLLFSKKLKAGQSVPFAPFLMIGTIISLYQGNELLSWYLNLIFLN